MPWLWCGSYSTGAHDCYCVENWYFGDQGGQAAATAWADRESNICFDSAKDCLERDILPGLQGVPLSRILEATGFSRRYASLARRGLYTPHPVHYVALADLVGSGVSPKP